MNKFLNAVWLRRADEQMTVIPKDMKNARSNRPVCIVCKSVRPRGGLHVCSRCFRTKTPQAREELKSQGLER